MANFRKRRFQEEETEETATPQASETTESETNSDEQLITILTEMGLSAESAQALYQMALDLAKEGKGEKVEASRMSRRQLEFKRELRKRREMRRQRMEARGERREFGVRRELRERDARRPMDARRERFARSERPGRELRRERFGAEQTDSLIRRQRATIIELRKQLKEFGAMPAAQRLSAQRQNIEQPVVPTGGSIQERVFNAMKNFGKR